VKKTLSMELRAMSALLVEASVLCASAADRLAEAEAEATRLGLELARERRWRQATGEKERRPTDLVSFGAAQEIAGTMGLGKALRDAVEGGQLHFAVRSVTAAGRQKRVITWERLKGWLEHTEQARLAGLGLRSDAPARTAQA
jgi:hypothetical protein